MLVDPDFAEWITTGGAGPSLGATSDAQARFTAYVGEVHRRATALTVCAESSRKIPSATMPPLPMVLRCVVDP